LLRLISQDVFGHRRLGSQIYHDDSGLPGPRLFAQETSEGGITRGRFDGIRTILGIKEIRKAVDLVVDC